MEIERWRRPAATTWWRGGLWLWWLQFGIICVGLNLRCFSLYLRRWWWLLIMICFWRRVYLRVDRWFMADMRWTVVLNCDDLLRSSFHVFWVHLGEVLAEKRFGFYRAEIVWQMVQTAFLLFERFAHVSGAVWGESLEFSTIYCQYKIQ